MLHFPHLTLWQKITSAVLILCLALSVGSLVIGSTANRNNRESTADTRIVLQEFSTRLAALEARNAGIGAKEYLLLEHEGKIGIFSAEKTALYEILDVRVSTLPARDREMLAEGITVVGESALRAILEDYSS